MAEAETAAPVETDTVAAPPAETAADTGATQTQEQAKPAFDGPEWLKDYPDEVRNDRSIWKYTNAEAATRALITSQRMIGVDKVPRPKGEFDPTNPDWQTFMDAMGRPANPDEYKFPEAKLPEGLVYDESLEGQFRKAAHVAGLNGKQAQMMRDMFVAYQADAYTGAQTEYKNSRDEAEAGLRKELGSAYEPYVKAAKTALKTYADDKFVSWLEESGMGNHPEIIRVFGRIGKETLGEAKLQQGNPSEFNTPGDWQRKAAQFQADNAHILYDNTNPGQRAAHAEWTRLMELAYPPEDK